MSELHLHRLRLYINVWRHFSNGYLLSRLALSLHDGLSLIATLLFLLRLLLIDALCKVLHFDSDVMLDSLKGDRVNKLGEGIKLLLVEQCQEVIAKSTHFAVTIGKLFVEDAGPSLVAEQLLGCTSILDVIPSLDSLKLRLRFGKGSFSHTFLVEEDYKRRLIIGILIFRAF